MNEVDRNAAFDKLEAFYDGVGMKTYDPIEKMGHKYGMESGSKETDQNFCLLGEVGIISIRFIMICMIRQR